MITTNPNTAAERLVLKLILDCERLPVLSYRPLRWRVGPELRFRPGAFPENMRPLTPNAAPESLVLTSLDGASAPAVGDV
jgi:hypothetical protein